MKKCVKLVIGKNLELVSMKLLEEEELRIILNAIYYMERKYPDKSVTFHCD